MARARDAGWDLPLIISINNKHITMHALLYHSDRPRLIPWDQNRTVIIGSRSPGLMLWLFHHDGG